MANSTLRSFASATIERQRFVIRSVRAELTFSKASSTRVSGARSLISLSILRRHATLRFLVTSTRPPSYGASGEVKAAQPKPRPVGYIASVIGGRGCAALLVGVG